MLRLNAITKVYTTGDLEQKALDGVSVSFRESEFVCILGQSGSGKTTMLNIIGGLDKYTSGDLIINGRSTKEYTDADWDTYRNHSIGFVFQSYNLIAHQSVLSNVELALTLSGVSKAERRKRATQALEAVGLGDQLNKKPNQMSGGQMQRVAIARALVNNPDILLADEPTGALDSETSVQIMNILKEVAKDRLVVMVTHNPSLAEKYSTRIIRLLDGKITDDTDPFDGGEIEAIDRRAQKKIKGGKKKRSMSFFTALSLSLNNLLTKKGRTFLTSFAGSIGIIGIALILSVSTGVQSYIDRVQEDTLSSYPITIMKETVDLSSFLTTMTDVREITAEVDHELDAVYESSVMYELINAMNSADTNVNNLAPFKKFLDSNEEIGDYLSGIQYSYGAMLNIYTADPDGAVMKSDIMELFGDYYDSMMTDSSLMSQYSSLASYDVWQELLTDGDGNMINSLLEEQYDVIAGKWPENYDEIVLIVSGSNELPDIVLYALGLKTSAEMQIIMQNTMTGGQIDTSEKLSWSYDELMSKKFKLIITPDLYQKNGDNTYVNMSTTTQGLDYLFNNDDIGVELKICGIIRANEDAVSSMISGSIGYTKALTDYIIAATSDSDIVTAQTSDAAYDVITGLPFKTDDGELTDEEKADAVNDYFAELSDGEIAEIYIAEASIPSDEYLDNAVGEYLAGYDRESLAAMMTQSYAEEMGVTDTSLIEQYINMLDDDTLYQYAAEGVREAVSAQYAEAMEAQFAAMSESELAAAFGTLTFTGDDYARLYDEYIPQDYSDSTYEANLELLGVIDENEPSEINLYASTFENKDEIARIISEYNDAAADGDVIEYTDYVALLMSSITTIINAISYVLIAFVAISLIVSSIMIGIITYISVLERTKEIGILRAIGASKLDISRVFNAETMIVGFGAGIFGIGITLLLLIPINIILHALTGIAILSAQLPLAGAIILVVISVVLTLIAGLIPSGVAAKKDPVVALRTE